MRLALSALLLLSFASGCSSDKKSDSSPRPDNRQTDDQTPRPGDQDDENDDRDDRDDRRDDDNRNTPREYCGYTFPAESASVTQAELNKLAGKWVSPRRFGMASMTHEGADVKYLDGLRFDVSGKSNVQTRSLFRDIFDPAPFETVDSSTYRYEKVVIGRKLESGDYAGYRPIQFEGVSTGVKCWTHLYNFEADDKLRLTGGSGTSSFGDGEPAPLSELVNGVRSYALYERG